MTAVTILMAVLLLSSGVSVFLKPPGPTSYPFHVATFGVSAVYLGARLWWWGRGRAGFGARPAAGSLADRHGRAVVATAVFFLCLGVYEISFRRVDLPGDLVALHAAWAFVRTGGLALDAYPLPPSSSGDGVATRPDGAQVPADPPGSVLTALPLVAPLTLMRERPLRVSPMWRVSKFLAAFYAALAVALFYLACQALVPDTAAAAAVLLGLGTSLYSVASQGLLPHAPATLWLCLALVLVWRPWPAAGRAAAALVGGALGLAVLTQPLTILFAAATVIGQGLTRGAQAAGWTAAGVAGSAAGVLWYNVYNFGHPLGPWLPAAVPAGTAVGLGVAGLLVAPSRGLLVYAPALLLAPLGLALLLQRRGLPRAALAARSMLLAWAAAAGAMLLIVAMRADWWGGPAFGPRLLIEALPALVLLVALAAHHLRQRRWWHPVAPALIAVSVTVHLLGVLGHHDDWNRRHPEAGRPASLFAVRDTQIEAHGRHFLRKVGSREWGLPRASVPEREGSRP